MFPTLDTNYTTYLDVGETSCPRLYLSSVNTVSGTLYLSYFTANKTENINTLTAWSGSTAAATVTLARMAVYDITYDVKPGSTAFPGYQATLPGDLRMIASTANDTSLFTTINTAYSKSLNRTWYKERGNRYAAALIVSASTQPSILSPIVSNAVPATTILAKEPRIAAVISGLDDLADPAYTATFSTTAFARQIYMEFT